MVHKDVQDQKQHTEQADVDRKFLREILQAFLQRGLPVLGFVDHAGDPADLRVHPHGRADVFSRAIGHKPRGKHHVGLVVDLHFPVDGRSGFLHRHRLTRQGGFVHLQGCGFKETAVAFDDIPRLHVHDIADRQLAGFDFRQPAVANDLDMGTGQALQTLQGLLGLDFLDGAQDRVQGYDHKDDQCGNQFAGKRRNDRGNDQDNDQKVLELPEKDHQGTRGFFLHEFIQSIGFLVLDHLCRCESLGTAVQFLEHSLGVLLIVRFHVCSLQKKDRTRWAWLSHESCP